MCVIIYVPKEASISMNELKQAWTTNPDGAGYAIQKDGRVEFKRGFMQYKDFENEVKEFIGKFNLLLHFRISTSKKVNKVQTHPYKKGNVTLTEGKTNKPVICMNGIISNQKEYAECNDTMSYIIDHSETFANITQDILNIIEEATGAKWAVMKDDEILLSSKFQEYEGRYYSNKNHLFKSYYYYSGSGYGKKSKKTYVDIIKNKNLRNEINKNYYLLNDICEYIDFTCEYEACDECKGCLKECKTISDIEYFLEKNWYYNSENYFNQYNTLYLWE